MATSRCYLKDSRAAVVLRSDRDRYREPHADKSRLFAGSKILLDSLDLGFQEVVQSLIAGELGHYIDLDKGKMGESVKREDELIKEGWTRRFVANEPRLSELEPTTSFEEAMIHHHLHVGGEGS